MSGAGDAAGAVAGPGRDTLAGVTAAGLEAPPATAIAGFETVPAVSVSGLDTLPVAVPGLDTLPFAVALRESPLLFAAVAAVHLLGVALLVGPVIAFDLRVLGVRRRIPVPHLARLLLPLAAASLVLVVPSGLAMFAARAGDLLTDRVFALKMLLVLAGGVLAVVFHAGPYRSVASWSTGATAPLAARACALGSLLGWIAVLALGRLLAAS